MSTNMNDTTNTVTASQLSSACSEVITQLRADTIPASAQDSARAAVAALEALNRTVERAHLRERIRHNEKQAKDDRARLAELDGEA